MGKIIFAHTITVCGDAKENCPAVFLNMGRHEHWTFEDPPNFRAAKRKNLSLRARYAIRSISTSCSGWRSKIFNLPC